MRSSETLQLAPATVRRFDPFGWVSGLRIGKYGAVIVPGTILSLFVLASIFASVLAPYDPNALDMPNALTGPSWEHPVGTDQLGRDLFSRLLYGGRATLSLAGISVVGIILIGLLVGVISGYVGGRVDLLISIFLTMLLALPSLLLTLAILGVLGPGTQSLFLALVGAGWVGHARVFRASILTLREQLFVEAAVNTGCSSTRIMLRHLVPNLIPTMIVLASLDLGAMLLIVSSLSFLGLGVQPPTADWGVMLNDARPYFGQVPFLIFGPGVCITLVALCSNLLGDAVRDLADRGFR